MEPRKPPAKVRRVQVCKKTGGQPWANTTIYVLNFKPRRTNVCYKRHKLFKCSFSPHILSLRQSVSFSLNFQQFFTQPSLNKRLLQQIRNMLGAPLVFQPWSVDVQPSMEPEWCQWLKDIKSKPAISLLQLAERKTPSSDLSDRPKFQQVDSLYIDYIDPKIDPHSAAQPPFAPRCFCLAKDLDNGIKVSRCGVAFLRINSDGHSRGQVDTKPPACRAFPWVLHGVSPTFPEINCSF